MFRLEWSAIAYKDLKNLETKEAVKILNALNDIQSDPYSFGDPLEGTFKGKRRMRIGDYRIVYHVNDKEKKVSILYVRHRREVYRA